MIGGGTVTLNIPGLLAGQKALNTNSEISRKVTKQWQARYRGFALKRFDTFSKGGGNWAKLAASTIKRRRKQSSTILRDKNLLYNSLNPSFQNAPGSFTEFGVWQVITGYGGPGKYAGKGTSATISDIAEFHNAGMGVPERKIIVAPDATTTAGMERDANNAINKFLSDQTGN